MKVLIKREGFEIFCKTAKEATRQLSEMFCMSETAAREIIRRRRRKVMGWTIDYS